MILGGGALVGAVGSGSVYVIVVVNDDVLSQYEKNAHAGGVREYILMSGLTHLPIC